MEKIIQSIFSCMFYGLLLNKRIDSQQSTAKMEKQLSSLENMKNMKLNKRCILMKKKKNKEENSIKRY